MTTAVPFSELLRRAGAVLTVRDGRPVTAHYGSVTTELAVCHAGVGLAERSDLAILSVTTSAPGIDHLLGRTLGHTLARGGATLEDSTWWCRCTRTSEVLVICPRNRAIRTRDAILGALDPSVVGTVEDVSDANRLINILGARTTALLADLELFGSGRDPQRSTPFVETETASVPARWLLASPEAAIAIVPSEGAADLWRAVLTAGAKHGISPVGVDCVDRYALRRRLTAARPALLRG